MQTSAADRDFSGYNSAQQGRAVRSLAIAAVDAASRDESPVPPVAVDLGCGRGIESRYLAEHGFTVHAIDVDPSMRPVLAALGAELPVLPAITDLSTISSLPDCDLLLACAALPFVPRRAFDALWDIMLAALRPGGILAVDLFGDRDDWAGTDGTYLARPEVEAALEGLEVLELEERERDGASFGGPKHWHTYRVLARRR